MNQRLLLIVRLDEGIDHDEWTEYVRREYVPAIERLSGIRRFTTADLSGWDGSAYDELLQLWFETPDDLRAAYESEAWRRIQEDVDGFGNIEAAIPVTVGDETVQYQAVPDDLI